MADALAKLDRLRDILRRYPSLLVAFSGGVDSTFLAAVAHEVLGSRVAAVTARSPSLPGAELEEAVALARRIGIRHIVIDTRELEDSNYVRNAPDRCFFCKEELFVRMKAFASREGFAELAYGELADDDAALRPGRRAAESHGVRRPLEEAGLTKAEVRELSKSRDLPTWDKPAAPCLSSRIPFGSAVTVEKLSMVERAEAALRRRGFRELRVRHHDLPPSGAAQAGCLARIEVPLPEIDRLTAPPLLAAVEHELRAIGYVRVEVDARGLRSGSLSKP